MNWIKYLLALSLTFSSSFVFAEPAAYIRSDGQFIANGNEFPRGFWWPKIYDAESVFSVNPEAAEAYEIHKTRAKWFAFLNWGAAGAAITYSLVANGNDSFDRGTFWAIFLIPWIGGLFAAGSSNRQLIKAINIVNGVPVDRAQFKLLPSNPTQLAKTEVSLPVFAWSF